MPGPQKTPLPIQFTPFKVSDFASDSGVAFINQTLSQLTTTLNAFVGAGGPTMLPAGADLQGASLTGLGSPSGASDAVPLGHANSAYGPATQQKALDLGGTNTLKGLAALQLWFATGVSGKVTLAKITGGGSNGSLTFSNGLITAFVEPS